MDLMRRFFVLRHLSPVRALNPLSCPFRSIGDRTLSSSTIIILITPKATIPIPLTLPLHGNCPMEQKKRQQIDEQPAFQYGRLVHNNISACGKTTFPPMTSANCIKNQFIDEMDWANLAPTPSNMKFLPTGKRQVSRKQ